MAERETETAYRELSAAFRQLDDFRAKLLGLLPLASGVGIFSILKDDSDTVSATLGFLGAVVTLGLGVHEFRTILRCKALIDAGNELERALKLHPNASLFQTYPRRFPYPIISTGVASVIVYGSVFTTWLYIAFR